LRISLNRLSAAKVGSIEATETGQNRSGKVAQKSLQYLYIPGSRPKNTALVSAASRLYMAYTPVSIHKDTPARVRKFIEQHLDTQFADIHAILRLPFSDMNGLGGCNFAAANSLLAFVSGFAAMLTKDMNTIGKSRDLFKKILKNFYPWDVQPPRNGGDISRTIDHLYDLFRSPLSHSLGLRKKGNFLVTIAKEEAMSEAAVEKLERKDNPPAQAIEYSPIKINGESIEQIHLYIGPMYWGTRQMLAKMTADSRLMQNVDSALKSLGL